MQNNQMQEFAKTSEKEVYDYIFKIIIIGNGSSGKSSILHYYINQKVKKNMTQTVGVEFASKLITLDSKNIKLQLWDTAGQERYRSVARTYYRGALGAIVVFDLTSSESFQAIQQWIKDARDFARQDISIVICGNKMDLQDSRRISSQQAQKVASELGIDYFETSAMSGDNIETAFSKLSQTLLKKIQNGKLKLDLYKEDLKPRLLNSANKYSKLTKESNDEQKDEQKNQCGYC